MSTQNEVNGAFPFYVNFYLHNNNIGVNDLGNFTLQYQNNAYEIVVWSYQLAEPTMTDLQAYTLSEVMEFNQAVQDNAELSAFNIPYILSTTRMTAVAALGLIPDGSLVWCSDDASMYAWNGSEWKKFAFV